MILRAHLCRVSLWVIVALPIALATGVYPSPSLATERIVLVGSNDTKRSLTGRWLNQIYTEVFRRLGYELIYQGYPNERANRMAEAGKVDGEIQRAASYAKVTDNLLQVREPSFIVNISAYAVKPGIVLDGWDSLKGTGYLVEYRRGSKVAAKALPRVVEPDKLSIITTVEQGLKKLQIGRTDIFIEQENVVTEALTKSEYLPVYQAGVMWSGASHLYMHKKHAALVPKISEVLREMKQEGLIEQYMKGSYE